jgi:hypothetical protein
MKVASRGYGDAVRALGHTKGAKVTVGRGQPNRKEGSDGELTLRNTSRGVILYAKFAGEWYSLHTNSALTEGMIIMWSGFRNSIPKGWFLCDGSNGTPDLQAKFIIGAGAKTTGGHYTTTFFGPSSDYNSLGLLSGATPSTSGVVTDQAITASINNGVTVSITNPSNTGDTTLGIGEIPSHDHSYRKVSSDTVSTGMGGSNAPDFYTTGDTGNTGGGGSHNHTIGSSSASVGGSITLASGSTNHSSTSKPLVDWYSLAFIQFRGVSISEDSAAVDFDIGGGPSQGSPSSSDIELKENIEFIGLSPLGTRIYEFEYIDKSYGEGRYRGVMAHEVPNAAFRHTDGYLWVDYDKVDVKHERVR